MDTMFVTQVQLIFNEEAKRDPKPLTNNEPFTSQESIASDAFSPSTYVKGDDPLSLLNLVYRLTLWSRPRSDELADLLVQFERGVLKAHVWLLCDSMMKKTIDYTLGLIIPWAETFLWACNLRNSCWAGGWQFYPNIQEAHAQ